MEDSSSSQKLCTETKNHSKGEEPINNENAEKGKCLKEKGNVLFLSGNWKKAVQAYTEAIELDGICAMDLAMLYSNRSIALLKDKKYEAALEDAAKAVELWPEWWKGYFRMGQVYNSIHLYKKAEACFNQAAEREPNRKEVEQALVIVKRKREESDAEKIPKTTQESASEADKRREYESHRAEAKKFMKDKYRFEPVDYLAEVEKRAKHSKFFRQVFLAEQHFAEAIYILSKLVNEGSYPLPLCEKFVEEFSTGAKIEVVEARMPKGLRDYARKMVGHILSLEAAASFHEDICVCYVELNAAPWRSQKKFLNECVHRYPFNAYFVAKRSRLLFRSHRYRQSLTDINTAIKLNPSNTQHLYHRADIMLGLFPDVAPDEAIEAFEEFLKVAPVGDPHVPFSFYQISVIYGRMSLFSSVVGDEVCARMCFAAAIHHLELFSAVECEQLPDLYEPAREAFLNQ